MTTASEISNSYKLLEFYLRIAASVVIHARPFQLSLSLLISSVLFHFVLRFYFHSREFKPICPNRAGKSYNHPTKVKPRNTRECCANLWPIQKLFSRNFCSVSSARRAAYIELQSASLLILTIPKRYSMLHKLHSIFLIINCLQSFLVGQHLKFLVDILLTV